MQLRIRIVNRYGTFHCESADAEDIDIETDKFRQLLTDVNAMSLPLNNGSRLILHKEMIKDSLFFIEPSQ